MGLILTGDSLRKNVKVWSMDWQYHFLLEV